MNTKEQSLSSALFAIGLDDNLFNRIHAGDPFSICYHLEYNTWQGKTNLQLNVKDIKFAEEL